uniref:Uncharacterized protein n=1 Tax=Steinernema glaseri TaxID=37863 RepID=A0A1I7YAG5_9BILA
MDFSSSCDVTAWSVQHMTPVQMGFPFFRSRPQGHLSPATLRFPLWTDKQVQFAAKKAHAETQPEARSAWNTDEGALLSSLESTLCPCIPTESHVECPHAGLFLLCSSLRLLIQFQWVRAIFAKAVNRC